MNRQTFYYHFRDIYNLLDWTFTTETSKILEGKVTFETWQEVFLRSCNYMLANKDLVNNVYHCVYGELLKRYLFVTNFYKYVFGGYVIEWVGKGMQEDPEDMVQQIDVLI